MISSFADRKVVKLFVKLPYIICLVYFFVKLEMEKVGSRMNVPMDNGE